MGVGPTTCFVRHYDDCVMIRDDLWGLRWSPYGHLVLNFAPVLFLYHVIQGNLISERNEEIRMHFVEQIVQRYLDLKPLVRRAVKEAFGA